MKIQDPVAAALSRQIASPLTSDDRRLARARGIPLEAFAAHRNADLALAMPLTASEQRLCAALGKPEAEYLAERDAKMRPVLRALGDRSHVRRSKGYGPS